MKEKHGTEKSWREQCSEPGVDNQISRKPACFSHLVNTVYNLSLSMTSCQQISRGKLRGAGSPRLWVGVGGKTDETVGGRECRDEREVTAVSAQQMLQLQKVSCNSLEGVLNWEARRTIAQTNWTHTRLSRRSPFG